jgi:hypothetical protein
MAAGTTREEARARVRAAFEAELERMIPRDGAAPLRGSKMIDFERQAQTLLRTVGGTLVEERCALERSAVAESAGPCPHCGSDRTRLTGVVRQDELAGLGGDVVLPVQEARCRPCGRSFSPSAPRPGG